VLLELWQAGAISAASTVTASKGQSQRAPEFSVCEPAMRRALRKRVPHATVHVTPWGVHAPAALPEHTRPTEQPVSVALLADSGEPGALAGALAGIAKLGERPPGVLIFAGTQDGAANRDSTIWSAARKLNVLDRLTLVSDMEARREPILDMDILVLPEATGRQRTIVLDAMARGMTIVAAQDELSETLTDDRVRLVKGQSPDAWTRALADALDDVQGARLRRQAAHAFVRSEKSASAQVASVMTAYNAMTAAAKVGVPDLSRSLS
jgi:hypothetical protein